MCGTLTVLRFCESVNFLRILFCIIVDYKHFTMTLSVFRTRPRILYTDFKSRPTGKKNSVFLNLVPYYYYCVDIHCAYFWKLYIIFKQNMYIKNKVDWHNQPTYYYTTSLKRWSIGRLGVTLNKRYYHQFFDLFFQCGSIIGFIVVSGF